MLVVGEIEETQRAVDPTVIGTLNRPGAVGWQIGRAVYETMEAIERNAWMLERAREVDAGAIRIYYWKSRQMMRQLPHREDPPADPE